MMLKHILIEWLKLKRNRYLWIFIVITPIVSIIITYLLAKGFQFKTTESPDVAIWQMWKSVSSIFFNIHHVIFTILAGFFLIAWQQQEHQDNTFKLYEILPNNIFLTVCLRFSIYYLICAIVFIFCLLIGIKMIEWVWIDLYPIYTEILPLSNNYIWAYLVEGIKATVILPISFHLFLFLFSLKNDKVSVSIVVLILSIILGFLSLPSWLFVRYTQYGVRVIRSIHSSSSAYSFQDLYNIYLYNSITIIIMLFTTYILSKQKTLFHKIIN